MKLAGWNYCKKITVPNGQIDADLPYFPMPVYLNSGNFDFTKSKADGADIRFTDKDLNPLKFERKQHSDALQMAVYNILIPTVSDLADTEVYMWYGNPNAYNDSIEAWQDKTGKQLTYNGNVKLAPNVAKFGKAAYFDGAGDYLTWAGSSDWVFDGNFDIDLTINPVARPSSGYALILGLVSGTGAAWSDVGWAFVLNADGTVTFQASNNGAAGVTLTSASALLSGIKNDIHVARVGNVFTLRINGVTSATTTSAITILNNTTWSLKMGWGYNTTNYLSAYIDEARVRKGTARTADFAIEKTPYTVDAYTKLLLHFDSAPFTDECGKTVTTYGDTKPIKTAYADGARGAYFDGTGDYFNLGNSSDFLMGTSNFCIEIPVKRSAVSTWQTICGHGDATIANASKSLVLSFRNDNTIEAYMFYNSTGSYVQFQSTATFTDTSVIYKVKFYREGNNFAIVVNDVVVATATSANGFNASTAPFCIGNYGVYSTGQFLNGYTLGARITKGRSRSAEAMPDKFDIDGSDVVFCTNFDTIYDQHYARVLHMGDTLADATGLGNNGTATGTTVVNTSFGKARSFGANTDNIVAPVPIITNKFTEMIMFRTDIINQAVYKTLSGGSTATNPYSLWMAIGGADANQNKIRFAPSTTPETLAATAVNITDPYVATGVYDGSVPSSKILLNGTQDGSNTSPTGNVAMPAASMLGKYYGGTANTFDGDMYEERLSTAARSAAWIKAESLALKNTLLTIADYVDTANSLFFGMNF